MSRDSLWGRSEYVRERYLDDRAMGIAQSAYDRREDVRDIPLAPWCPCPNCRKPVDEEERLLVIPGFEPAACNLGCASCIEEDAHIAQPAPPHIEDRIRRNHAQEYFQ